MLSKINATPIISIVMASYNTADFIGEAIESILNQTFNDFELIIYDDCSTDNTIDIIGKYEDHRIRLIKSNSNCGENATLKKAVAASRGKYIGQLDSDDMLHRDALRICYEELKDDIIGFVFTDNYEIDTTGVVLRIKERGNYSKGSQIYRFISFHFRMFSKDAYDKTSGIDDNIRLAADYDISLKLEEVTPVKYIKIPLYYYRIHDKNSSKTQYKLQSEHVCILMNNALKRRSYFNNSKKFILFYNKYNKACYKLVNII